MIPKLTDFTAEELKWIMLDLNRKKNEIFVCLDGDIPRVQRRYDSIDWDICMQWLTKLTEALQEVERQDRINSN